VSTAIEALVPNTVSATRRAVRDAYAILGRRRRGLPGKIDVWWYGGGQGDQFRLVALARVAAGSDRWEIRVTTGGAVTFEWRQVEIAGVPDGNMPPAQMVVAAIAALEGAR